MSDAVVRVRAAWATMLGTDALRPLQVIVEHRDDDQVSIVRVQETVTVVVPRDELVPLFRRVLGSVAPVAAVDPGALRDVLPPFRDVLGPASLFYAVRPVAPPPEGVDVELVPAGDLSPLVAVVPREDLDESGIAAVTSPVSIVRGNDGAVIAACGHATWPAAIAHLCVLTHPSHRGVGLARAVGAHAATRAAADGLLPQWRARVEASKAVARAIGLVELGSQLRLTVA